MDDPVDRLLRQTLERHPRPQASPGFADAVLRLVAAQERSSAARNRRAARLVMAAYWLAASAGTAWVLSSLPAPSWAPAVAAGLAIALVPVGYAVFLWPAPAARWAVLVLRPLLALPRERREG